MELQCYQPILEVTICFQPLGVACWYWEASARLFDFHGCSPLFQINYRDFLNVTYVSFIMGPAIFYSDFAIHPLRKDGYSTLATLTARAGFKLYKIRPKLHMMCHLACLGSMFLREMDGRQKCSIDGPQKCCQKNVAKKMLQQLHPVICLQAWSETCPSRSPRSTVVSQHVHLHDMDRRRLHWTNQQN